MGRLSITTALVFCALTASAADSNVRWKKVWSDEFNGQLPTENDSCYHKKTMCVISPEFPPVECPDSAIDNLANLNKCNWSVVSFTNLRGPEWAKENTSAINAFDPSEVYVSNGELNLTTKLNPGNHPTCGTTISDPRLSGARNKSNDCQYVAGGIMSRMFEKANVAGMKQTYGRFEIRARMSKGSGAAPRITLLPQKWFRGWPYDSEMSLVETTPDAPNTSVSTFHGSDQQRQSYLKKEFKYSGGSSSLLSVSAPSFNLSDEYHLYAVEWDPLEIRFFVDKIMVGIVRNSDKIKSENDDKSYTPLLPHDPFYFMIYAGVSPYENLPAKYRPTADKFETQKMMIDYVRYYSRCEKDDKDCIESTVNPKCTNPCDGIGRYDGHGCMISEAPEGFRAVTYGRKLFIRPDSGDWLLNKVKCPEGMKYKTLRGCLVQELPENREAFALNDDLGNRHYAKPVCEP